MSNSEKGLWSYLNPKMKEAFGTKWHAERIETGATACGQPDVNYCLMGKENNIELKHATATNFCRLRPSQYQWMKRRLRAGKLCWILVELSHRKTWILISSAHCQTLIKNPEEKVWVECAMEVWQNEIDFEKLKERLVS